MLKETNNVSEQKYEILHQRMVDMRSIVSDFDRVLYQYFELILTQKMRRGTQITAKCVERRI